ncbi:hypothetical protein [Ohtaekwangia koreensis]|uniref:Uncharacterized protein n=1 Tax=Ohtaekwangia koreensis TaxID=688867 RepID=A0A1T5JJB8_9BACT|nr:hypothetical protein [Ohtaekwangia koreensis]SKC51342.1 hypothetical protein SAMN05660236_1138 [Ohtaekwangia koreensis]
MKQLKTLIILLFVASVTTAQDRSDVFKADTKITWLGLDFSKAKLIGDREKLGSESDIRYLLESWNKLIVNEEEKFDIALAIEKKKIEKNIQPTLDHNATLEVLSMLSNAEKDYLHLNRDGVAEIIASYDFKGLSGIGLMFNIESFSKLNEEASIWVTFINIDTKEVLFSERVTAEPRGFGMRNFWGGALFVAIERIKKKEYEMWRKKYYRP